MTPPRHRDHTSTHDRRGRRGRPRPGEDQSRGPQEQGPPGGRRRRRGGGPRDDSRGYGQQHGARGEYRGDPRGEYRGERRGDPRGERRERHPGQYQAGREGPPRGRREGRGRGRDGRGREGRGREGRGREGGRRDFNRRDFQRRREEGPPFRDLIRELQSRISIDPYERLRLETRPDSLSMRALDLVTPIGKGQRCLIVAPPKAGKTTLLIDVARSVAQNHPEVEVYALLVDERPEEVTGFRRGVTAEVMAASSDMSAPQHIEIAERCLMKALESVLAGKDVMILMDSITRLARAYNTVAEGVGRTLSGGLDAATMHTPRQFFGAARKIEDGGSLTILGTALIDTGSRMDQVIFEEFKGTGNTELVLSRKLFEMRIFPCIDIAKSGTRKEEKLYPAERVEQLHLLRRALARVETAQAMRKLLELLARYKSNEELLDTVGAALSQ